MRDCDLFLRTGRTNANRFRGRLSLFAWLAPPEEISMQGQLCRWELPVTSGARDQCGSELLARVCMDGADRADGTCSDDFLSLWSSSPASQCHSHCGQLRLRVLFLTLLSGMHAGCSSHAFGLCELVFLLNEASSERLLFSLAVHRLSAECGSVFADLALYLTVGGLASVELSYSLTTLVLQARLAPMPRLPILDVWTFSRSLSQARLLSARDLQHRTWRLSCCLLEVGRRHVPDLAASHRLGSSVPVFCTYGVTTVFCATLISS